MSPTTILAIEPLRISDKLSLVWRIPLLGIRCMSYFASECLSHYEISALNWRQKLAIAYLKAFGKTFTEKQQAARSRVPLTGPRIRDYCRRRNLDHREVRLDAASFDNGHDFPTPVLHFVTAASAQPDGPTIFYSHGGGYHNPIQAEGHVPFVALCAEACKAKQVVFLEYSLSPEQQYPCQLVQAVAGLRFLLNEEHIPANYIILGGDSAGGHLTASLLTHVIFPSPYAPPIDLCGSQFRAVFLVSPWLTMLEKEQGVAPPQAQHDYLTPRRIVRFTNMFQPVLDEVWANPSEAPDAAAVWKRLFPEDHGHAICRKAILVVGTSETILKSCVAFGRHMIGCGELLVNAKTDLDLIKEKDFVLAVISGEAHVQPALDCALRYYGGLSLKTILTFLASS